LGDIAHAIGYLAKLATFTVLATTRTDGIVNGITEEHTAVELVDVYMYVLCVYKDADKGHNARHQF
jgi:hypothetical protein